MLFSGQTQIASPDVTKLVQAQRPEYWKVLTPAIDDRAFLLSLKPTPLLGRLWLSEVDGTWKGGQLTGFLKLVQSDPVGEADRYADKLIRHPNADLIDAWESPNEPFGEMHIGTSGLVTAYDRFLSQLSRRLLRAGKTPVIGVFGSGAWVRTDFDAMFLMTAKLNPVLALHEYGWPNLVDQEPRHAFFHTKVSWPGDIWITELGITNAVDGQGPDVGFLTWPDEVIPHYLFGNRKAWYRDQLTAYRKRATAQMAFLFGVGMQEGDVPPGWGTFEAGPVLRDLLSGKKGPGRPETTHNVEGDERPGSNGPVERV